GEQLDGIHNLAVGGAFAPAVRFLNNLVGVVAVRWIADRDGLGDRVGLLRLDDVGPLVDRGHDGIAARGLRGINLGAAVFDDADFDKLAIRFVNLGQNRSTGGWDNRVLRESPAELLGDFKAKGFGAFGVVRAKVHVDDGPAVLVRDLGTQTIDVVV